MLTVDVLGNDVNFSIDALTILAVLFITMVVITGIGLIFKPGMFYLAPIFILTFLIVGTFWQGFWIDNYLTAGENLGVPRESLLDNLMGTGVFLTNPLLLGLNIIAFVFIFSKLYRYIPGID